MTGIAYGHAAAPSHASFRDGCVRSLEPGLEDAQMLARLLAAALLAVSLVSTAANSELSDDNIRALLIKRSLASYSGNCPCPYFTDRAGRRCGARSAYSKPGGESPLCFQEDVTPAMIEAFRKAN